MPGEAREAGMVLPCLVGHGVQAHNDDRQPQHDREPRHQRNSPVQLGFFAEGRFDPELRGRLVFEGLFLRPHYAVISASCIDEALVELEREAPAVVISDLDLREDRDGLSFLEEVAQRWPSIRRVLLTGHNVQTDDPRLEAVHRLARKPLAASALVALVSEELAAR